MRRKRPCRRLRAAEDVFDSWMRHRQGYRSGAKALSEPTRSSRCKRFSIECEKTVVFNLLVKYYDDHEQPTYYLPRSARWPTRHTARHPATTTRSGRTTVSELAEPFEISLPAVSKHLRVLERAQLISRETDAQWRL